MTAKESTAVRDLVRAGLRRGSTEATLCDDRLTMSTTEFWTSVDTEVARLESAGPKGVRVYLPMSHDASQVEALIRLVAVMESGRSVLLSPEDWTEESREYAKRWCFLEYGTGRSNYELGVLSRATDERPLRSGCLSDFNADAHEAVVLFTSGSTGTPKGVRLASSAVVRNVEAVSTRLGFLGDDEVVASPLSLAHSFGLSTALLSLARGWGLSMTTKRVPDRRLAAAWEDAGVTVLSCVPFFLELVSRRRLRVGRDLGPSVKAILTAGAGVEDGRLAQMLGEWDGDICTMYGMTEATARVAIRRHGDGAPADSVGLPLDGVHVRIVDEKNESVSVGVTGRVAVATQSAMIGYLGEPPIGTAEIVTQDLGRLDGFGHLTIVGRMSDMLNFRGNRVHLTGLESLAKTVTGVDDCVVVPGHGDDVPAAFHVQLSPGADFEAVKSALRQVARPLGIVGRILIVERAPRTASGKVRRVHTGVDSGRSGPVD